MTKPALCIFLGDLHVGSNAGLCKPGYMLGGEDKARQRKYSPSAFQAAMYAEWVKLRARIKTETKGHRLYLMLGGDLVDGVNHHGTTETVGNHADQRDMAIDLLLPWVSMAECVYGVTGTEAHVGSEGEDDRSVYGELCKAGNYAPRLNMVIDGRRLWWAHHGVGVGGRAWTASNPMYQLAQDVYYQTLEQGLPRPDVIIGHHRHRAPQPVTARGITVAVCPCWQGSTYYGSTIAPHSQPDYGVLVWRPGRDELRVERVTVK